MSLRNRPVVTPKMIAANRANAGICIGTGSELARIAKLSWPRGGKPAEFDGGIGDGYCEPHSQMEARQIQPMAYENWLLTGECEKTIFFFDQQKPECYLESII